MCIIGSKKYHTLMSYAYSLRGYKIIIIEQTPNNGKKNTNEGLNEIEFVDFFKTGFSEEVIKKILEILTTNR